VFSRNEPPPPTIVQSCSRSLPCSCLPAPPLSPWRGAGGSIPQIAPSAGSSTTTVRFIKTFSEFVSNTTLEKDLTPEDVVATSDGGYAFLASTVCPTDACVSKQNNTNSLVNWLVKTDSNGKPQWRDDRLRLKVELRGP
jgi:hypothetical protein